MADNRPIGVFDSGVGGLTVLQALQRLLPNESTIYVGDLARCPYGPRSQDEVCGFATEIADHLAEADIKLLVVACNTATAAAYRLLVERYSFPVVGVIEPGARRAVENSQTGRIGVLATDGTVSSHAYSAAITRMLPTSCVIERAASWLVPVIEEGEADSAELITRLTPDFDAFADAQIDTLILGCTHFPLVRDTFADGIGTAVTIVDSAQTSALEVAWLLRELAQEAHGSPNHRLLVTGSAERFVSRASVMFQESPVVETLDPGTFAPLERSSTS